MPRGDAPQRALAVAADLAAHLVSQVKVEAMAVALPLEAMVVALLEAMAVALLEAVAVALLEAVAVALLEAVAVALLEAVAVALLEAVAVALLEAVAVALLEAMAVATTALVGGVANLVEVVDGVANLVEVVDGAANLVEAVEGAASLVETMDGAEMTEMWWHGRHRRRQISPAISPPARRRSRRHNSNLTEAEDGFGVQGPLSLSPDTCMTSHPNQPSYCQTGEGTLSFTRIGYVTITQPDSQASI